MSAARKRCRVLTTLGRRCPRLRAVGSNRCRAHRDVPALAPDASVPDYCAVSLNGSNASRATRGFFDVTGAPSIQIRIRADGRVLWVHAGKSEVRICGIRGDVVIVDQREEFAQ